MTECQLKMKHMLPPNTQTNWTQQSRLQLWRNQGSLRREIASLDKEQAEEGAVSKEQQLHQKKYLTMSDIFYTDIFQEHVFTSTYK